MPALNSSVSMRRGVLYIYGSLIAAFVLGLASSSITARLMTAENLGQYRFIVTCVSVLTSALTLGMYSSAGVLLAGRGGRVMRLLVAGGASAQAWLVALANVVCVAVLLLANASGGTWALWLVAAVLAGATAWPLLLQELLRAKGNFVGLAALNAAPAALFLLLLGVAYLFRVYFDVELCAALFFLSQVVVVCGVMAKFGISAEPSRIGHAYLLKRNQTLGLNVYWGSFLAALGAQSGIFILQTLRSSTEVAVFALAMTITAPLSLLPSAVGTAYFSKLPGTLGYPKAVVGSAWALSIAVATAFSLVVPIAIHLLYGDKFASVTLPAQICSAAALLQGMGDVYNRYYLANQKTQFLLRVSIAFSVVAVFGGLPAGQMWGPIGVAIAKLLSSGVYCVYIAYRYHKPSRGL